MSLRYKAVMTGSTILLLMLLCTDPRELPSIALILPFILLMVVLSLVAMSLLNNSRIEHSKRVRISFVFAAVPTLLLVLQSLGQLTVRDTFAILLFFGIAYFYAARFGVKTA